MQATTDITRPALRYYGGKFKLAPWVIDHFPPHGKYIEPYGGAASVLLQKPRSTIEVYNDLDQRLVNLFAVLRDHGEELRRRVELTPFSRAEFDAALKPADDPIERARQTLVRSWLGFNGTGLRRDRTGFRAKDNSANGHACEGWARWPLVVPALTARLKQVVLECRPALELFEPHDGPDTLFYLDPPYMHETRSATARADYTYEMHVRDHRRLLARARQLKGMVVISGYATELYDKALRKWHRFEKEAVVATNGGQTGSDCFRTEVLWLNEAAQAARERELGMFKDQA